MVELDKFNINTPFRRKYKRETAAKHIKKREKWSKTMRMELPHCAGGRGNPEPSLVPTSPNFSNNK